MVGVSYYSNIVEKELVMYSWLKFDEVRKLQRLYDQKFEEALLAQRSGNIKLYGQLIAESERIFQQINAAKKKLG